MSRTRPSARAPRPRAEADGTDPLDAWTAWTRRGAMRRLSPSGFVIFTFMVGLAAERQDHLAGPTPDLLARLTLHNRANLVPALAELEAAGMVERLDVLRPGVDEYVILPPPAPRRPRP